ncbi:CC50A protein, partial [Polypterus senegalus]|nr:cell cycle control protein 50B [Polypterus senegalus]MBN3290401.1 CC50A protein [Polypterus senegalus]
MKKDNKPDNTAFTQQRLPAWQPVLSVGIVLPLFFIIGLAFIGIGIGLLITSNNIQEFEEEYTGVGDNSNCYICANNATANCKCTLNFTIAQPIQGSVFMYYGLTNYYQNHQKYLSSRDDQQLAGDIYYLKNPSQTCKPYQTDASNIPIAPCGSIANSLFNDAFALYYNNQGFLEEVKLDGSAIAWWTDHNVKFSNPSQTGSTLKQIFEGTVKPINWSNPVYKLDVNNPDNNGFINEDFLVWMRTAALPDFRKLYRRISGNYSSFMPSGNYTLEITYNYPVKDLPGKKKVIFSTVSWMGGKNPFLGIAYLAFGSLCFVMGFILLIVYAKYQNVEDNDD